jgi:hypothetical protein
MRSASVEANYFVPISNEVAYYMSAKRTARARNQDSHTIPRDLALIEQ